MEEASKFLDEMNLSYDIDIVSAHRTPKKMFAYAENATKNGINVIIAGAGGAVYYLPGMVASLTPIPVIGAY